MYVKYGNFRHPLGSVGVSINKQTQFTERGAPQATEETWTINGLIYNPGGSQSTMSNLIQQVENAYSVNNLDLKLLLSDGTSSSRHQLIAANCIGGVRVIQPPSFPEGRGPEYRTKRTFTVQVQGVVPVANAASILVAWDESIRIWGGGPKYVHLETLIGSPVKQTARQRTLVHATQSGRAVGYLAYPSAPDPIWPQALVMPLGNALTLGTPQSFNGTKINWPISWEYVYESATPLFGFPTIL